MVRRPPRSPPFPSTTLSRSVTYPPTATAGSHKVIATYDESSSALHAGSSGSYTITVNRRTTSTTVSCSPTVVAVNANTTCTATVSDTDNGTKSAPSGTVTFAADGAGTF